MNQINAGRTSLKMSIEADCLDDCFIQKIKGEPIYEATVIGHIEPIDIQVTPVFRDEEKLWCDIVTGSLYNELLACISSDRLKLESEPVKTKMIVGTRTHTISRAYVPTGVEVN